MLKKVEEMKKKVPHGRLAPIFNLIQTNELRGPDGQLRIKLGVCEKEVMGEKMVIGESLKVQVTTLNLW